MSFRTAVAIVLLSWAAPALAQTTGTPITLEDAERRALDKNPQIAQARLGTDAADFAIAQEKAVYSPSLNLSIAQRSQTNPATSQLAGGQSQVTNSASNYGSGISQELPWGGGHVSLDFSTNRNATSNVFSTYNPSFSSSVNATWTQPLLGGFRFDTKRAQIAQAELNRGVAGVQLRQQMAKTLNAVRHAYWELVYSADALDTARRSENLAKQQLDDNRLRVQLGTVAPIDVVESEAEVASRHQAVIKADGAFKTAQVALKQLIVAETADPLWGSTLLPIDRPLQGARAVDVAQATANAIANRTDLAIARTQTTISDTSLKLLSEQRKPAVDLVASYSLSGIGGTRVLRETGALGSQVVGTIPGNYFDTLRSIGALDYPTWSAGLDVTLPLGKKAADAAFARGQVEKRQAELRVNTLELQVAADVTRSVEAVRTAEEQVQAAAAARQLAQKRLEAEQARRQAGLSTTFLVSQAQRDLATAETTELRALLDYRTALADFDLAQEAP